MCLFSKKEKQPEKKFSLNEEKELNLFADDIHSEAFLEKVRELKDVNKKFQKGLTCCTLHVNIRISALPGNCWAETSILKRKTSTATLHYGQPYSIPGETMK